MSLASKMAAVESCDDGCDCERKISDLSWTKDSEKGAILRIKRKRTEDPFKALRKCPELNISPQHTRRLGSSWASV